MRIVLQLTFFSLERKAIADRAELESFSSFDIPYQFNVMSED